MWRHSHLMYLLAGVAIGLLLGIVLSSVAWAQNCSLPSCSQPGALAPEPFREDQIGYGNSYKLRGNLTHARHCLDAEGCEHSCYLTIYDCFASRQGAPPGYCQSDLSIGQPVRSCYYESNAESPCACSRGK